MSIRDKMTSEEQSKWDTLQGKKTELEGRIQENRSKIGVFMPEKQKEPINKEWVNLIGQKKVSCEIWSYS